MLYTFFKTIHVIGVVLLLGNVTITAFWKVFADRTGDPRIIAFGQRLVTITDFVFTLGGIVLIYVGGFAAAALAGLNPFAPGWLLWGHILFLASGLIWVIVLIPAQIRLARAARPFADGSQMPSDEYRRLNRRWLIWGIIACFPLVAAVWVMIDKPS